MFSICDSSGNNICSFKEFNYLGNSLNQSFEFNFSDSLVNNYQSFNTRYFQYRIFFEAQENLSCSNSLCVPSVKSVKYLTKNTYYNSSPSIASNIPINISKEISSFSETISGGCSVKYQFSKDGTNYSYYKLGEWVSAIDSKDQANVANELSQKLKDYINTGDLYVRTYLISDGSSRCEISELKIMQN